ncbi:hypothetical protein B0J11DRAFT_600916 [Dendryphion nanum]|uniref:Secreted protein n=1 Tax=Dendryphion nanum TaxID=256645 RepID=A0A9P9IRE2_9PLEO|nr:hypothetical protein B0J11DRAFT_600916 [Dendryphion nanum]
MISLPFGLLVFSSSTLSWYATSNSPPVTPDCRSSQSLTHLLHLNFVDVQHVHLFCAILRKRHIHSVVQSYFTPSIQRDKHNRQIPRNAPQARNPPIIPGAPVQIESPYPAQQTCDTPILTGFSNGLKMNGFDETTRECGNTCCSLSQKSNRQNHYAPKSQSNRKQPPGMQGRGHKKACIYYADGNMSIQKRLAACKNFGNDPNRGGTDSAHYLKNSIRKTTRHPKATQRSLQKVPNRNKGAETRLSNAISFQRKMRVNLPNYSSTTCQTKRT